MKISEIRVSEWVNTNTLTAFVIGFFTCPTLSYFSGFLDFWQELIGAFLGAATPVAFYLWNEYRTKRIRKNEHLQYLIIAFGTAINNLSELDTNLHRFINGNLIKYLDRLASADNTKEVMVGQTFIPLTYIYTLETSILKERLDSPYLENMVTQAVRQSQDIAVMVQDIHRQFDSTLALNTQMGMQKLMKPKEHNDTLKANLESFRDFILNQTFKINIPMHLRHLVQTMVALEEMHKIGLASWRKKFNYPPPYNHTTQEKMDEYFKESANKQIGELKESFQSELIKVGVDIEIPKP